MQCRVSLSTKPALGRISNQKAVYDTFWDFPSVLGVWSLLLSQSFANHSAVGLPNIWSLTRSVTQPRPFITVHINVVVTVFLLSKIKREHAPSLPLPRVSRSQWSVTQHTVLHYSVTYTDLRRLASKMLYSVLYSLKTWTSSARWTHRTTQHESSSPRRNVA